MTFCKECGGSIVRCPFCHHYHCDELSCMPLECARAEE